MVKKFFLKLIKFYQKYISADHGGILRYFKPMGVCRFQPSCSEYTFQAIEKYGVLKGVWVGLKRILRCNPFSQGGWDPIDHQNTKNKQ